MNEPENLDHDRFADDGRRRSRLRRDRLARARARSRARRRCVGASLAEHGRGGGAPRAPRAKRTRPCPDAARGPLRGWL